MKSYCWSSRLIEMLADTFQRSSSSNISRKYSGPKTVFSFGMNPANGTYKKYIYWKRISEHLYQPRRPAVRFHIFHLFFIYFLSIFHLFFINFSFSFHLVYLLNFFIFCLFVD